MEGRTRAFFVALPPRSKVFIWTAVFFTFGTLGFIDDIWKVRELHPPALVAAHVIYVGLVAVLYVISFTTSRWVLLIAIPFQFVQVFLPHQLLLLESWIAGHAAAPVSFDAPAVARRLRADGIGCLLFVMVGYGVFIRFIGSEGLKHMRLRTEVALAERIHSALVPPLALWTPRFELLGRSEPSSTVGGDLIDAIVHPDGLVACVADVSGHGVAAGTFMGMVKSAIRMKLLSSSALDALLDDLDQVIGQVSNPETFVTFAGLRFDATNVAELALAGHLPILHLRAKSGAIESVDNDQPPLGVVAGVRHTSRRVPFEPGDLFVLLTDGLTEVANLRREQLGGARIERLLGERAGRPLAEIYDAVLAAVRDWGPQTDDQTLMLIRIR